MKLVRGQGLAKLIAHTEQERWLISCSYTHEGVISDIWYQDIVYFLLKDSFPNGMNSSQCRTLRKKCASYMLKDENLYQKNYEGLYLKCLNRDKAKKNYANSITGIVLGMDQQKLKFIRF